jgi:GT2 family glycosyltransferase
MTFDDITVVIVTFKSEHKIYSCLDSIPDNLKIIIVENSSDKSFKKNVEEYRSNVECFILNENYGYAYANNFGLSKIKSKYGLVLNPDTRLTKNTINKFLNTASNYKNFWLIGPEQNFEKNLSKNDIRETKTIKGYAMFFNIEKFNNIFFDENFFLYFEEIDLCKSVLSKKGLILIDKNIIVEHDGGSSVDTQFQHELDKNRNWHWMWSTFYFHKKYKGLFISLIIILPKFISALFKFFLYKILNKTKGKEIYYCRLSGILNSIRGNKSWYRPRLN